MADVPSDIPPVTQGQNQVIPLKSSYLSTASYDQTNLRLTIEFLNGHVEQYIMVYPQSFTDLIASPSPGKYFHDGIKGKFASVTIKPAPKGKAVKEQKVPDVPQPEKKPHLSKRSKFGGI